MGPVFNKVHLQIIQLTATIHRRTRKKVKNAVKLKKTRGIPMAHPVSREKGSSFHTNHGGQKRKQLNTNDDKPLEIMREICKRFNHCKNHQIDAEDQFPASLADDL